MQKLELNNNDEIFLKCCVSISFRTGKVQLREKDFFNKMFSLLNRIIWIGYYW
jgi:hypothetical protein